MTGKSGGISALALAKTLSMKKWLKRAWMALVSGVEAERGGPIVMVLPEELVKEVEG